MNQRQWRIAIDVPTAVRAELLRRFPPRFELTYGCSITWATNVEERYPFDTSLQRVTLYGHHSTLSTETFTVRVGDDLYRERGLLLHLVHSTAFGVMPKHAGLIDLQHLRLLGQASIQFEACWARLPMPEPAPVPTATPYQGS